MKLRERTARIIMIREFSNGGRRDQGRFLFYNVRAFSVFIRFWCSKCFKCVFYLIPVPSNPIGKLQNDSEDTEDIQYTAPAREGAAAPPPPSGKKITFLFQVMHFPKEQWSSDQHTCIFLTRRGVGGAGGGSPPEGGVPHSFLSF